jgi:hypothetical protein
MDKTVAVKELIDACPAFVVGDCLCVDHGEGWWWVGGVCALEGKGGRGKRAQARDESVKRSAPSLNLATKQHRLCTSHIIFIPEPCRYHTDGKPGARCWMQIL